MDLSFIERQEIILGILERNGRAGIAEFAKALAVAEITVRRDLERLEAQGLLMRTRGGALYREPTFFELFFEKRLKEMETEKHRIGQAAARMVQRGDVIFSRYRHDNPAHCPGTQIGFRPHDCYQFNLYPS